MCSCASRRSVDVPCGARYRTTVDGTWLAIARRSRPNRADRESSGTMSRAARSVGVMVRPWSIRSTSARSQCKDLMSDTPKRRGVSELTGRQPQFRVLHSGHQSVQILTNRTDSAAHRHNQAPAIGADHLQFQEHLAGFGVEQARVHDRLIRHGCAFGGLQKGIIVIQGLGSSHQPEAVTLTGSQPVWVFCGLSQVTFRSLYGVFGFSRLTFLGADVCAERVRGCFSKWWMICSTCVSVNRYEPPNMVNGTCRFSH